MTSVEPVGGGESRDNDGSKVVVVTTAQPVGMNQLTISPVGHRAWSSGICDCCLDKKSCLMGCFCYCCTACLLSKRLDENICLPLFTGVVPLRLKLRLMLGIRGSGCNDCLMCCCPQLAICQMTRELDAAGWHK